MEELRNSPSTASAPRNRWPAQGWIGLLLIAICWPLNWTMKGVTAYLFFPLWLGYILVVDALVAVRRGSSMWTRSRKESVLLFVASSPVWWMFEVINRRTTNWEYLGSNHFTTFEYYLLCTISFSTVMPAVFETAELVGTFKWVERFTFGPRIRQTAALEPLNSWLGREHFMEYLERGDWRPIVSLSVGALICGFFWEMWNYYSWPKWIYHTPGAQFLEIFEMPLLGYGGYVPFALELFVLRNLLWRGAPRVEESWGR